RVRRRDCARIPTGPATGPCVRRWRDRTRPARGPKQKNDGRSCGIISAVEQAPSMTEILIVFYSRNGATRELARHVARGVESVAGCTATLRTVPPVSAENERPVSPVPDSGAPYATL